LGLEPGNDLSNLETPPQAPGDDPLPDRLARLEAQIIRETLETHQGDVRRTIEALGIPRKTFYDKLQRHGIIRGDFAGRD
jgi:two-component system, NtrC family, C4-dicarboxylate transport response regulator DctD